MILMAYSRQREYAADAGAAKYVGRQHMIDALLALDKNFQRYDYVAKPSMNHLMIFSDIK